MATKAKQSNSSKKHLKAITAKSQRRLINKKSKIKAKISKSPARKPLAHKSKISKSAPKKAVFSKKSAKFHNKKIKALKSLPSLRIAAKKMSKSKTPRLNPKIILKAKIKGKKEAKAISKVAKAGIKVAGKIIPGDKAIVPPKPPELPKKTLSPEIKAVLGKPSTRNWLIELGGENTLSIIKSLPEVPNDEAIAKKLKIRISDVRSSLNKLHNSGLVAYLRDKNNETGWYSYAWVLNEDRISKWVVEREQEQQSMVSQQGIDMYFCKECGLDSALKFEIAIDHSFKCPCCSAALELRDQIKLEQIKKEREDNR